MVVSPTQLLTPGILRDNFFRTGVVPISRRFTSAGRAVGSVCLLVAFSGVAVRALTIGFTASDTSGRNPEGQVADSLNTTRMYSLVRNPPVSGKLPDHPGRRVISTHLVDTRALRHTFRALCGVFFMEKGRAPRIPWRYGPCDVSVLVRSELQPGSRRKIRNRSFVAICAWLHLRCVYRRSRAPQTYKLVKIALHFLQPPTPFATALSSSPSAISAALDCYSAPRPNTRKYISASAGSMVRAAASSP